MNNGMQHLSARRRLYRYLEPFPSKNAFKRFLDYLMYGVAIVQPLALVPQAINVLRLPDGGGASPTTWTLLGVIGILWVVYGLVHKEKPIVISNVLSVILDFTIVWGIYH